MFFAFLTIAFFSFQNVACKEYGRRFPDTVTSQLKMTLGTVIIVTVIMALLGGAKPLDATGYLVAAAFGVAFVAALCCMTLAMSCGHLGITLLIQNSSLIVPTIFGLIVWKEELTVWKGAGILLILIMLILSSGDLSTSQEEKARYAAKRKRWVIYTAAAFLADSALSILQGVMGRACGDVDSQTFTFWTSIFSIITCLVVWTVLKLLRPTQKQNYGYSDDSVQASERLIVDKKSLIAFSICVGAIGLGTAVGNMCSILALSQLPGVILYPLRQGSLVLVMWLIGILVYHEKANRRGLWMLIIGLAGLILLNL